MTYLALTEVGCADAAIETYVIFIIEFCKKHLQFDSILC